MGNYLYVSFDPGAGKKDTIGVCCWDHKIYPARLEQFTLNQFHEFLQQLSKYEDEIKAFIVENYVVDPRVPHGGSEVGTIRTIGALQYHAKAHGIDFVLQPRTILTMAQLWSGKKFNKKASMRERLSAYLHGYYYLHKKGLIAPRVLTEEIE